MSQMRMMQRMKVLRTKATSSETSSEIDLFEDVKLPRAVKVQIAEEAGSILQDIILKSVGGAKSPISGESWPGLSPAYKKFKQNQNRPGKANMEFSGDMLDSLDSDVSASGKLTLGYFGDEAEKADGHNNFSGKSDLPQRRSLPGVDQTFKKGAVAQIDDLIAEAVADSVKLPVRRLQNVKTKKDLFNILSEVFPGRSRNSIRDAILNSDDMLRQLSGLDLLQLLTG